MLESEIKKLTTAIETLNATLLSTQGGANANTTGAPATASAVQPTPATIPGPGPGAAATPAIPQTAPAAAGPAVATPAIPATQPGAVTPGAPPASAMTHQQAQAELGAIVQALGPGDTRVQQTMVQYGSARLNEIPAENLFSLVQACKALLAA